MSRAIISILAMWAVPTGCSQGVDSEPSSTPTSSPSSITEPEPLPATCSKKCSNQEVAASGCDAGQPQTVGEIIEVSPDELLGVSGVLELRMSDPAVCDNIYWARFRPYADSTEQSWVVEIVTKDRPREEQPSVPGDPTIDGFTEGVYVKNGTPVVYCLRVGRAGACGEFKAAVA